MNYTLIKQNTHEMMNARGFDQLSFATEETPYDIYIERDNVDADDHTIKGATELCSDDHTVKGATELCSDDERKRIIVFFVDKINNDRLKNYKQIMEELNIEHCVAIYYESITSFAKNGMINDFIKTKESTVIEALSGQLDLLVNPTEGYYYNPHERVSEELLAEIKSSFPDITKLPTLLKSDRICRYFNYQSGEVIKVTRRPRKSHPYTEIVYRYVK